MTVEQRFVYFILYFCSFSRLFLMTQYIFVDLIGRKMHFFLSYLIIEKTILLTSGFNSKFSTLFHNHFTIYSPLRLETLRTYIVGDPEVSHYQSSFEKKSFVCKTEQLRCAITFICAYLKRPGQCS